MNPRTAGLLVAGGAVAMVFLERFTKVKDPGKATRIFIPEGPAVAPTAGPQPPPPAFSGPRQAPPGPVQVNPGILYRASVNVAFPLALLASASKAQGEAVKQGFTNVSVATSPPPGWPGGSGKFYITGTYSGPPKFVDRSAAAGQVTVTDVWMG